MAGKGRIDQLSSGPDSVKPEISVAAFTAGIAAPSARFRLRQFSGPLKHNGIRVMEHVAPLGTFPPKNKPIRPFWAVASIVSRIPSVLGSWSADVTFFQREMLSTFMTLEPFTRRPRVLDVDDAIYLHRAGHFARRIANRCDLILCGNDYLAEQFGKWSQRIEVLPTAVDSDLLQPRSPRVNVDPDKVVIGWIGTSANHQYLRLLESALSIVFASHPEASLLVVSDRDPGLALDPERVAFRRWSEVNEVSDIQSMDIGVMPLADTPWARGKCSFKMLQYMSCAIPVVVSPVGMNAQVLSQGVVGLAASSTSDWVDAITSLVRDREQRRSMGEMGREVVQARYSVHAIAPRLEAAIRSVT